MRSKLSLYDLPIYIQALIGISLLVAIGLVERFTNPSEQWVKAPRSIKSELLTKIIQDNATDDINPETIKSMELNNDIYLVDFNSQKLCGRAGCLYVAYTERGDRVLSLILQPQPDLFSINSSDPNRTCIDIRQPQGNQTLIHTYCYEGDKFINTISSATD